MPSQLMRKLEIALFRLTQNVLKLLSHIYEVEILIVGVLKRLMSGLSSLVVVLQLIIIHLLKPILSSTNYSQSLAQATGMLRKMASGAEGNQEHINGMKSRTVQIITGCLKDQKSFIKLFNSYRSMLWIHKEAMGMIKIIFFLIFAYIGTVCSKTSKNQIFSNSH